MASNNMGSYVCLIYIFNCKKLTEQEPNLKRIQLDLFEIIRGDVLKKKKNRPNNVDYVTILSIYTLLG